MNKLTFPLLAALATVEELAGVDDEQKRVLEKLSILRQELQKRLPDILERSDFIEKSRLQANIEESLADAAFLTTYPELLGKTCVAIIMADATVNDVLGELTIPDTGINDFCKHGLLPYGTHIHAPQMLVHTSGMGEIKLMSLRSGFASLKGIPGHDAFGAYVLSPAEYDAFLNLEADGIDPAQMVRAIVYHVKLKYESSIYLLLRPEDVLNSEMSILINQCDVAVIYGAVENQSCLAHLGSSFHMPVYFVNNQNNQSGKKILAENSFVGRIIQDINRPDISDLFKRVDGYIQRITLKDKIYSEIMAVLEDTARKINAIELTNSRIDSMTSMFSKSDKKRVACIDAIRSQNDGKLQHLNKLKTNIKSAIKQIVAKAGDFETELGKRSGDTVGWHYPWLNCGSMRPETVWRRIILRSLEAGDTDIANHYQSRYADKFPEHALITQLYKDKKTGCGVSTEALEKIRYMRDSQEVFRAKIFWRRELGLSEHDCAEIAGLMKRHQTADEKYFYALHLREKYESLKARGGKDDALFEQLLAAHWDAILTGSDDAANELAMYCGAERLTAQSEELASTGSAMGLYVAGLLTTVSIICRTSSIISKHTGRLPTKMRKATDAVLLAAVNGQLRKKRRYITMAAACEHEEALAFAAESLWQQSLDGRERVKDGVIEGLDSEKLSQSIAFYLGLSKKPEMLQKIPKLMERLGFYYYCTAAWPKASSAIGEHPETPEGQFSLAMMKRYGYGMPVDRDASIRFIRQAESGSGPCAALAAETKKSWLDEEKERLEDKYRKYL